jgi:hypothetical protein
MNNAQSKYGALAVPTSRDVIADLARQTERPVEEVESVYSRQLTELEAYATVFAYVPLFAKRRARDILRSH